MRTHIAIEIPYGYTSHECFDLLARGLIELQRAQYRRDAREARSDAHNFARIIRMLRDNAVARTHTGNEYAHAFACARRDHREALRALHALPVAQSIGEDAPTCDALAQQFAAMADSA